MWPFDMAPKPSPAPHQVVVLDPNRPTGTLASQPAPVAQPVVVLQQSAKEAQTLMSLISEVEKVGSTVANFLKSIVTGAATLQKIWSALSGPTLAAAAAVFYDVVNTAKSGESTAEAAASGNFSGAVTLSETTIGLIKKVVADAKAGEKTIVADFEALGIKL